MSYAYCCGPGQSNMAYGIGGHMSVNNSREEIQAMASYPHIRLYQVGNKGSDVAEIEVANTSQGWSEPCSVVNTSRGSQTVCRSGLSAICWFYGRAISEKLDPPRPLGLIETNVGGTPDESWSSREALLKCTDSGPHGRPLTSGHLWNGMVHPLLNLTINGAVWYQGEQVSAGDPSACTRP